MLTSDDVKARYGDRGTGYLSLQNRNVCRARQRGIWATLKHIVGTTIDEPWTLEVHSPRALPAFIETTRNSPNLVWDVGLGTLLDHLSFSMPFPQPAPVIEASVRRIAAIKCVVAGYSDQASEQVDFASGLLKTCPIDRSYQESVGVDRQFEVYLITEMQERFALAHELAHYIKAVDESSFDKTMLQLSKLIGKALESDLHTGTLKANARACWRKEADNALRQAGLNPYAWYLRGQGPDPFSESTWLTLASDLETADSLFKNSTDSEREEIACDLLGALTVVLDAHNMERGWTAIAGAASARLALTNLQVLLDIDEWVASGGDQPFPAWATTTRQHCLNAYLSIAIPAILRQAPIASTLQAGDIHTVMHLVEERSRTRLAPGLSNLSWCEFSGGSRYSSDEVLMRATFFPFRAETDHRVVNRAAGNHSFPLGTLMASPAISSNLKGKPGFSEQVDAALRRHQQGDWGEVEQEDWDKNDSGLFEEFEPPVPARLRFRDKLWSLYYIDGERVLVTTTPDRTVTEIHFMREYI